MPKSFAIKRGSYENKALMVRQTAHLIDNIVEKYLPVSSILFIAIS